VLLTAPNAINDLKARLKGLFGKKAKKTEDKPAEAAKPTEPTPAVAAPATETKPAEPVPATEAKPETSTTPAAPVAGKFSQFPQFSSYLRP